MAEEKVRKSRAGKPALSRDRIEEAALELIEEIGLESFSIRKLGIKLECEAMSLYHYFGNKGELLDALVERLLLGFQFPDNTDDAQGALRFLAHQWRKIAHQYPNFFRFFSLHRMNSETGVAFLNRVIQLLLDMGMQPEQAARFFRVINYYLIGATLDETAGYAKGGSSLAPVADDLIRQNYPALAGASRFFSPDEFDKTFEYGLELILRDAGADRQWQ